MSKNLRPGSMGAAEAKSTKRFFIGATVVLVALVLLFVIPFPVDSAVGYAHAYFARASNFSKGTGIFLSAAWLVFLWVFSYDIGWGKKNSAVLVTGILLVGLALILACLAGFNFDLHGIQK